MSSSIADRGVYRPGETVHLAALLRDTRGQCHGRPAAHHPPRAARRSRGPSLTLTDVQGRRLCVSIFRSPPRPAPAAGPCRPISIPRAIADRQHELPGRGCRAGADRDQAHHQGRGASSPVSRAQCRPSERNISMALRVPICWSRPSLTIEQDSDPFAKVFPGYRLRPGGRKGRAAQVETWTTRTTDAKGQASFDMTPADLPDTPAAAEGDLAHGGL